MLLMLIKDPNTLVLRLFITYQINNLELIFKLIPVYLSGNLFNLNKEDYTLFDYKGIRYKY